MRHGFYPVKAIAAADACAWVTNPEFLLCAIGSTQISELASRRMTKQTNSFVQSYNNCWSGISYCIATVDGESVSRQTDIDFPGVSLLDVSRQSLPTFLRRWHKICVLKMSVFDFR